MPALRHLGIRDAKNWMVPRPLRLPASLRSLGFANDGASQTGDDINTLIQAIDSRSVRDLESLTIRVGGLNALPPIRVDLGFLRCLRC